MVWMNHKKCYAEQKPDSQNTYTKMPFLWHSTKAKANQCDKRHINDS